MVTLLHRGPSAWRSSSKLPGNMWDTAGGPSAGRVGARGPLTASLARPLSPPFCSVCTRGNRLFAVTRGSSWGRESPCPPLKSRARLLPPPPRLLCAPVTISDTSLRREKLHTAEAALAPQSSLSVKAFVARAGLRGPACSLCPQAPSTGLQPRHGAFAPAVSSCRLGEGSGHSSFHLLWFPWSPERTLN